SREGNPRSGRVHTGVRDHAVVHVRIRINRDEVSPISEGGGEAIPILVGRLVAAHEAVGNRLAVAVPINTGQGRQDVIGGVGNKMSVVVGKHSSVVLEEVEQMRHLLQVGRNVGVIPLDVQVIELDVNNVADRTAG